jgi:hypothetical protein
MLVAIMFRNSPQADVVKKDGTRELGHVGILRIERSIHPAPRVNCMQALVRRHSD